MGTDSSKSPSPHKPARPARVLRALLLLGVGLVALLGIALGAALWTVTHLDHPVVKPLVLKAARSAGLELDYDAFAVSLGSGRIHGEGISLAQPARFAGKAGPFVTLRGLDAEISASALLSGRTHIPKLELDGLTLTYVADETGDSVSLLFPSKEEPQQPVSEPETPLSHSLARVRELGVTIEHMRVSPITLRYVELAKGRAVRQAALESLAFDGHVRPQGDALDVALVLSAVSTQLGQGPAALRLQQESRTESVDGSGAAREPIDANARLAASGALRIEQAPRVALTFDVRVVDPGGLPVPAGLPLDAALAAALDFDQAGGRTRLELTRLSVLGGLFAAQLRGHIEDASPDTLREASGRADLVSEDPPWLPEGVRLHGLSAHVRLDRAQLSPQGVLGSASIKASLDRAQRSAAGQRASVEGMIFDLATEARVPSAAAAEPSRFDRLRVAFGARRLNATEAGSGAAPATAFEGRDLAASLHGPALILARNRGPAAGSRAGDQAERDEIAVRFSELTLTKGRATRVQIGTPALDAKGAGLVSALANDAPATGDIALRATRVTARNGSSLTTLAPFSSHAALQAIGRAPDAPLGLRGRARVELETEGSIKDGPRHTRLASLTPQLRADFDRNSVELTFPIERLDVREAGQSTFGVRDAELHVALVDPTDLAPPRARGSVRVRGRADHIDAGGNTMTLPEVKLDLTGKGGAYAMKGEAAVDALTTGLGKVPGTQRFDLEGRVDLQAHRADLEAHLRRTNAAAARSPTLDASLHAAIEPGTGVLQHRIAFETQRLAPELAPYLPPGTRGHFSGLRFQSEGRLSGLFARAPAPGELPQLRSRPLRSARGNAQASFVLDDLTLAREGAGQFACPKFEALFDLDQRGRSAVATLKAAAPLTRVERAGRKLELQKLRPSVRLHVPDVARPDTASLTAELTLAAVDQNFVPGYPISNVRFAANVEAASGRTFVREIVLSNPAGHTELRVTGAYENELGRASPREDLERSAIDGREALALDGALTQELAPLSGGPFAQRASGRLRVPFRIESGNLQSYRTTARIVAETIDFESADGTLAIQRLNGEIPIDQTITLLPTGTVRGSDMGENALSRARFPDVQPFLNHDAYITADRIRSNGQTLGPLAGNVRVSGTTFGIDRLQVGYRGGSLTGQLEADLKPGAALVVFRGNATGIRTEKGGDQVLDANLALRFAPETLALDGTAHLVRLSKAHLHELLDALDPFHENPQMNKTRSLLALGYPRFAKLQAAEGLMDFEISLGGLAGAVSIDPIRAIPIAPMLEVYAAPYVDAFFPREKRPEAGPMLSAKESTPRGGRP